MTADRTTGRLLTPEQAAEQLQVNWRTLSNWRWQGRGPRYIHAGGLVRYRASDLERWLTAQSVDPDGRS